MMIARSIVNGVGRAPNVARRHLHRECFEYPNRCDRRCSHDREWCIRRAQNNSVGRCHVEIFVRPMRYKGCHQAHNAKVVICALFTTPNSLELQGRRKAFSPNRKSCTRTHSRQIPTASDAPPRHTSRGFLHWRFAYAGPGVRRSTFMGRHPKTFTETDLNSYWYSGERTNCVKSMRVESMVPSYCDLSESPMSKLACASRNCVGQLICPQGNHEVMSFL